MEIDDFIKLMANVKDKEVKKLIRTCMRKGRNKVLVYVRKVARKNAKSKNNIKGRKSYLRTYKGGKIYQKYDDWRTKGYNMNRKANFLEKKEFSKWHKKGLNAFEQSKDEADKIFKSEVNKVFKELIRRF